MAGHSPISFANLPWLLLLSLLTNFLGLLAIARVIQGRGGIQYLKSILLKDNEATVDIGSRARRDMFATLPAPARRPMIFVGDSITSACEWGEAFTGVRPVLNRGIGGDTSLGVLERMAEVCRLNPTVVFLMIGTNDPQMLGYAPTDTLENVRIIIRQIQQSSPDASIYVQSVLPSRSPKFNRWSSELNHHLNMLADGRQISFVDLRPLFLDHENALNSELTYDGLHLNARGFLTWRHAVGPLIEKFVGEEQSRESSAAA